MTWQDHPRRRRAQMPPVTRVAVLLLTADDELAVVDAETGALLRTVKLGVAPLGAVVSADGSVAWVTELGGPQPKAGDRACATMPRGASRERCASIARGIAEAGTVVRVDLVTGEVGTRIGVGRHPTAIVWDEKRDRAYVADGNSDDAFLSSTHHMAIRCSARFRSRRSRRGRWPGLRQRHSHCHPTGPRSTSRLAASMPWRSTCRLQRPRRCGPSRHASHGVVSVDAGYLAGRSRFLAVGHAARRRAPAPVTPPGRMAVTCTRCAARSISWKFRRPANCQRSRWPCRRTIACRWRRQAPAQPRTARARVALRAIPERPGEPSLIHHVVYIIRENRTYDQVLGDLGKGDGDTSLVMYGRDVTPNTHALSEQFTTLDRFFASGGNSADGHQWLTQANETEYTLWPLLRGAELSLRRQ